MKVKIGREGAFYFLEQHIEDHIHTFLMKINNPDVSEEQRKRDRYMCAGHLQDILRISNDMELEIYISKKEKQFSKPEHEIILQGLKDLAYLHVQGKNRYTDCYNMLTITCDEIKGLTDNKIRYEKDKILATIDLHSQDKYRESVIQRNITSSFPKQQSWANFFLCRHHRDEEVEIY